MRYALLVCGDEQVASGRDAAEQAEVAAAFEAFSDEIAAEGILVAQQRLRATSTATTVRVRGSGLVIADGPFAETKEQIGGFYLIECQDLDQAIEVASRVPAASFGSIEVRPVWET
jgi:hypothetical protein